MMSKRKKLIMTKIIIRFLKSRKRKSIRYQKKKTPHNPNYFNTEECIISSLDHSFMNMEPQESKTLKKEKKFLYHPYIAWKSILIAFVYIIE